MDGFVTGPTLAVLFVTVWQIFSEEFGTDRPLPATPVPQNPPAPAPCTPKRKASRRKR